MSVLPDIVRRLAEYLADPESARFPFKLDYFNAEALHRGLKRDLRRDLSALTWFAEVKCSGGWMICGAFVDEASAWEFGAKHLDVRMWKGDECIGVKDGYKRPWRAPTEEDLSQ